MAKRATQGFCAPSPAPNCSSWTTGVPRRSLPSRLADLLEIVEDRYDKGSLIITSEIPVDRWHDLIGVPDLADEFLDRRSTTPTASTSPGRACASRGPRHDTTSMPKARAGSLNRQRGKACG